MATSLTLTLNGGSGADWDVTVVRQEQVESPAAELDALPEPDLIAACLAGTPGAFDLIVSRHRRPVYQICYRFMGNHEDASDLSQDVFLRAYRGLANFKGNAALGTWLHRIAVNTCLNRVALKTPKVEPIDETQHVDTSSETPTERLLRGERAERVRAAVAQLPDKQRAALVMRTYQELSHQEIAAALGTSVGAAKANVFHALQNLKKILGDL
ncbi:MAG: sigma-70 family RNA polymerase sigma factor [Vicinamibacterales bacterium]